MVIVTRYETWPVGWKDDSSLLAVEFHNNIWSFWRVQLFPPHHQKRATPQRRFLLSLTPSTVRAVRLISKQPQGHTNLPDSHSLYKLLWSLRTGIKTSTCIQALQRICLRGVASISPATMAMPLNMPKWFWHPSRVACVPIAC